MLLSYIGEMEPTIVYERTAWPWVKTSRASEPTRKHLALTQIPIHRYINYASIMRCSSLYHIGKVLMSQTIATMKTMNWIEMYL